MISLYHLAYLGSNPGSIFVCHCSQLSEHRIWIQGFKSEGLGTLVDNSSPEAKTVVLGGLDYPVVNDNRDILPSFWNRGGSMTVVIANYWTNLELVREEVNGIVRSYRKPLGERFTFYTSANPAYLAN